MGLPWPRLAAIPPREGGAAFIDKGRIDKARNALRAARRGWKRRVLVVTAPPWRGSGVGTPEPHAFLTLRRYPAEPWVGGSAIMDAAPETLKRR